MVYGESVGRGCLSASRLLEGEKNCGLGRQVAHGRHRKAARAVVLRGECTDEELGHSRARLAHQRGTAGEAQVGQAREHELCGEHVARVLRSQREQAADAVVGLHGLEQRPCFVAGGGTCQPCQPVRRHLPQAERVRGLKLAQHGFHIGAELRLGCGVRRNLRWRELLRQHLGVALGQVFFVVGLRLRGSSCVWLWLFGGGPVSGVLLHRVLSGLVPQRLDAHPTTVRGTVVL